MRPEARAGVVAIGRNEGERLRACLHSALGAAACVVYVDSGSSDGSADMARGLGAAVVALDPAEPFTAARARNEGFRRLRELEPALRYVQFVDGDCTLVEGWVEAAVAFLAAHPDVAAVCGRRRERHPERSLYNLLCDLEWATPLGEAKACGGDVMMRADALAAAGGYRAELVAGEEPELCVRLRAARWRIWRLDRDMSLHDAAMTRFVQWWRRAQRAGYAFALGAALHGASPERHWVRESRSAWVWGLGLPLAAAGGCALAGSWASIVLAAYPLQVMRLFARGERSPRENFWHALFVVVGKFAEVLGQLRFMLERVAGGRARLIEYK
jgi:glycosyltransferase involved in cell wall biosynthesis